MSEERDAAYHQFHSARRKKLLDYVEKRTRGWKKKGGNDSPPVRTSYAYEGMERLPGHKDKDIWDAAWEACMKSTKQ